MKFVVNMPFLWFKRGQVIEATKMPRLDIRYLEKKGMIALYVEPEEEQPKPRKPKAAKK